LSGALSAVIAARKGYGERVGLTFGLLLSVVGLLIVLLLLPGRPGSAWRREGPLPSGGMGRLLGGLDVGVTAAPAVPGQLVLTVDQDPRRSRLATLLRWILVIPHLVVLLVWSVAATLASVVAWFAIVFTGQYPLGVWEITTGFVGYSARVLLFMFLAVDEFPPFSGGPDGYPAQTEVSHLDSYDRLKTAFRFAYIIPAYVVAAILSFVVAVVALIDWVIIVITGRQPRDAQVLLVAMIGWSIKATALAVLVTEDYDLAVRIPTR
jgi:Domain of unknown function (DUF4389)